MKEIQDKMLELLEAKGEVSAADFRAMMPGVPEQTVFSRIRALERHGLVYQSGRGKYQLGAKPAYHIEITPRMLELSKFMIEEFAGVNNCICGCDKDTIMLEVDKRELGGILTSLRSRYTNVYSFKEAIAARNTIMDAIIVKPLITDSPLLDNDGVSVPALEKKLVDLIADRDFFRLDDRTLQREFQRAFEVYPINRNRLLRYAGRRNVAGETTDMIDSLNQNRIKTIALIQKLLSQRPVERAWLFGSWSRQEERPDSDLDVLVDYDRNAKISLLDHAGYVVDMEEAIGRQVDLVENGCLLPFAERTANKDKYLIYARRA